MSMQHHPGYPDRISNRARMQSNRLLAYQSQAANSVTAGREGTDLRRRRVQMGEGGKDETVVEREMADGKEEEN
ncbi:hypothetical protein NQZ68_019084 [Dissostichus eleginoides]|nr:hypothetical protein NQZ68_019084 [Dissostichus eleginoides]